MESFLNRYRNITVLFLVIFAQLLLLAVQVKNDQDVYLIRVWTVTAVTPMARILEGFRGGSIGFIRNYIMLHDADAENRRLQAQVDRLKVENIFLKNELNSAERAKALQVFQAHTPSTMLAASVIMTGAGSNSKVVFVDRGSRDGVMRGMAVVTPDGIVGKVIAAYPTGSEILLVTDPDFAAGVVSQKTDARGTFKGQGTPLGRVDYVPNEEKVAEGDWFYTSGDDRVFPRGFPVGQARVVRPKQPFQEILVEPSGLQRGLEDVLIVVAGVHQDIPETPPVNQPVYIAPPPPAPVAGSAGSPADASGVPLAPGGTVADKLRQQYKAIGDAEKHKFGEGEPGSPPPDFTKLGQLPPAAPSAAQPANTAPATPAGGSGTNPNDAAPARRPPEPAKKSPAESPDPSLSPGGRATPGGRTVPSPADPAVAPPKRPPEAGKKPSPNPPGGPMATAIPATLDREFAARPGESRPGLASAIAAYVAASPPRAPGKNPFELSPAQAAVGRASPKQPDATPATTPMVRASVAARFFLTAGAFESAAPHTALAMAKGARDFVKKQSPAPVGASCAGPASAHPGPETARKPFREAAQARSAGPRSLRAIRELARKSFVFA